MSLPKAGAAAYANTAPAATVAENVVYSPTSGAPAFFPSAAPSGGKDVEPEEKVLVERHITNSGATVRVVRVDYSSGMRAYRITQASYLSDGADVPALLRLVSVNDLLLISIIVSCLLPYVLPVSGWVHQAAHAGALDDWISSGKLLLVVLTLLAVLLARLLRAYRRVYMEEVIAIRGVGLQMRTYGIFGQVKAEVFVSRSMIRSLVIHDAFFRFQPIFFLSASVENQAERLVFFDETLPRLEVLQPVLRGLRHILYGEDELSPSLAEQLARGVNLSAEGPKIDDDDSTLQTSVSSEDDREL